MSEEKQIHATHSRSVATRLCEKMSHDQRLRMHMIKNGASADFCTLKEREKLPTDDPRKANKDPEVKSMFVACRVEEPLSKLKADNADILLPLEVVSRALTLHRQFGHCLGTFIAIDHPASDGPSVGFIAVNSQDQFHPHPKVTTAAGSDRTQLEIFVRIPSAAIQVQSLTH